MNIKEKLTALFQSGKLSGKTETEILRALSLGKDGQKSVRRRLEELCDEGVICRDGFRYDTPERLGAIEGVVSANKNGFGFLVPLDRKKYPSDFYIHRNGMNGAYHGDRVLAVPHRTQKSEDEVRVVRILERASDEIVGTFARARGCDFVRPDEERLTFLVSVPPEMTKKAKNGEKVVVRIAARPKGKDPIGEVIEVLGKAEDFDVEELSLLRAHGLREEFPQSVLAAAAAIPPAVPEEDKKGRLDLRDRLIVTVDGEDTRDIDDAISVEKRGEHYLLGVHIADVSHYVSFQGTLDKEAFKRGTSAYFPDKVLPMLPKELSNGICSLNEGVDRLTLSCLMTVDKSGNVIGRQIAKSVIRSVHRMTYHAVQDIADGKGDALKRYPDMVQFVSLAYELTAILKEKRRRAGEVELDVKEAKILRDENGKIVIPDYEYLPSQGMIEQFMILANEQVAEEMTEAKAPFVYRIHEKPKSEKAESLRAFLLSLGVSCPFDTEDLRPQDYRKVLKSVEGQPVAPVVNRVMLRSMAKARYDAANVGHFGLSSASYCHFTSPIRRYPDLCIHRIIKEVIDGKKKDAVKKYAPFVGEAAAQSSECERRAIEAERDVDDLYKTHWCAERIGEEFEGVISGVLPSGFFVELKNTVEGFVSVRDFPERFEYFEDRFLLRGGKYAFRIGDGVKIRVAGVDLAGRKVDFLFISKTSEIS